jgi:hypothetical protein
MFVLYIIVINRLNKIWNSFQILFYLGQRFLNQFYLSTNRTFFLIYLGWWIISWSLKYLYIVYIIPNLCSFITSINTTRKLINTNGNTEGITVGKKIKTKQKKNDDVSFLPTELPTDLPTAFIPSVNLLVNCEHCSSC